VGIPKFHDDLCLSNLAASLILSAHFCSPQFELESQHCMWLCYREVLICNS
jgi:hypothetical protein